MSAGNRAGNNHVSSGAGSEPTQKFKIEFEFSSGFGSLRNLSLK